MNTVIEPASTPTPSRNNDLIWNILTFLVLLGTACLVGAFSLIYINPRNALNPFPPAGPAAAANSVADTPVPTPTDIFPPTWTPTANAAIAATEPPAPDASPTAELPPTQAPTFAIPEPSDIVTPPPAPADGYAFTLWGDPVMVASTMINNDQGCDWMGIGGKVSDLQGAPLVGVLVQLGGELGDTPLNQTSLTGTAIQYGPAGYELRLADQPMVSQDTIWIQLLDQAGLPLSEQVKVSTSADCQKNLILINFKQVH